MNLNFLRDIYVHAAGVWRLTTGRKFAAEVFALVDGITAPGTASGLAQVYVDTADGDAKVKFGDGTVVVIPDTAGTVALTGHAHTIDNLSDVGGITAILTGSTTWNPGNIGGGGRDATPITITGAEVGDEAVCGFTLNTSSVLGCIATVTATDTCTPVLHNLTTGTASDLGSGTVRCLVIKR